MSTAWRSGSARLAAPCIETHDGRLFSYSAANARASAASSGTRAEPMPFAGAPLAHEAHDIPLDAVITENALY